MDNIKSIENKKILICGLGSIGRRHLRVVERNWPSMQKAVLRSGHGPDCSETKLINFQPSNLDEAINWKPQAAIISSPANNHLEQALILAKAGIPIFIEKPIGVGNESQKDWEELLKLSESIPILVGYVLRHDPCALLIKQQLKENVLGPIIEADFHCGSWLPDWRPEINYLQSVSANKNLGGGVLLELSHELDIANWLLGPIEVDSANLQSSSLLPIDVEDRAIVLAHNEIGALITIRLNFCSQPSRRKATIRGQKGEIVWDLIEGNVVLSKAGLKSKCFKYGIERDELFSRQIKHFMECINTQEVPVCSLKDGLNALKLVQRVKNLDISSEGTT